MPFWQENKKFLLRVGAALAITLLGYSIVMGTYRSARIKAGQNSDMLSDIEILAENLGRDEARELGRRDVLGRRWDHARGQVTQTLRPKFDFADDKGIRLIQEVVSVGDSWREKFEKRNMRVDESVRNLGGLGTSTGIGDVDEKIARLDLVDRLMQSIYATGLNAVAGITHEKRDVVSIKGSDVAIVRIPIRLDVEGSYSDVAALIKGVQLANMFVQVGKADLKPGANEPVRASIEVAALYVRDRKTIEKGKEDGGGRPRRRPRRRR